MRLLLMVVIALQSLEAAASGPARGSLCLSDPGSLILARHCRSVEGSSFEVETDSEERIFAWISSDRSVIALGVVPASANIVTLPESPVAINLEVKGSKDRGWPQTTALAIGTRETPGRWRIELSPIDVVRLRTILLPAGTWDVRLRAARHAVTALPLTRVFEPLALGVMALEPLPQIRGTVIDREGEFIRSAVMISHERELLTTSGNFGEILYEAPCTGEADCVLPKGFRIEYPGTAAAWFSVTNRTRDFDFATLRLAKGGTLNLELDRSSVEAPLVVEILDDPTARIPAPPYAPRMFSDAHEKSHRRQLRREAPDLFPKPRSFPLINSAVLTEDESSAKFENLPEGQLRLVVRGREQGEYLSRFFHVTPEETLGMKIAIQPAELTVDVSRDGQDVEGVPVLITQWNAPWHRVQSPPTDTRGRSTVTIWEKGKHSAQVVDPDIRAATLVEIGEEKTQNVAIDVIPASVSARIVEAGTETPVSGVAILFEDLFYRGDSAPRAVTDDDGRFEIESVMTEGYNCEIRADGFLPVATRGWIRPGHNDLEPIRLSR
ncbi:MAG: carboxypeptidase-like regulatory domain-containing protein, partial [Thermoanaerobaculia bacterium]